MLTPAPRVGLADDPRSISFEINFPYAYALTHYGLGTNIPPRSKRHWPN